MPEPWRPAKSDKGDPSHRRQFRTFNSRIREIVTYDGSIETAEGGDAVTLTLTDELDITRGDVLVAPTARPEVSEQFAAHVIWMDQKPLFHGRSLSHSDRDEDRPGEHHGDQV